MKSCTLMKRKRESAVAFASKASVENSIQIFVQKRLFHSRRDYSIIVNEAA